MNQHPLVYVAEAIVIAFVAYGFWRTWKEIRDGE